MKHAYSTFFIVFTVMLITLGVTPQALAQSALDGFDPNANNTVRVVAVQPDGKILIGGDFTTVAPNGGAAVTRNRIARFNHDGTLDTAFNPNADNAVLSIALQSDGKVLAGGQFNTIGGQTRNRLARLDASTGLADSFNPNADFNVETIAVQVDGKILAGGQFTNIGGQTRNRIARLDAVTGAADSFDPNSNGEVVAITLQADGNILVGGVFNGANCIGGQTRSFIARLDAATGLADSFNPNPNTAVQSIAVQADGKIIVGGGFASIGGQTRNRLARLDAVTGLADSFNPNANSSIFAIAVQPDGKILASGGFTSIGGQARNRIARLDPATGSADSFDPNPGPNVFAIALQPDGKILIGGAFTTLSPNGGAALTRNRIARLEPDGRADRTLNDLQLGIGTVLAIAVQPDGKILIGGSFTSVLGVTQNRIARLNTDGTLDLLFNPDPNDTVRSIAIQADGKIIVGGSFTFIGGQTRNRIARLGAATGLADSFNPHFDERVRSVAVQPDGRILVGGDFQIISGQFRNYIARLDPVTGLPDSFNPAANGLVVAIAVQADGKILAGGDFNFIGGDTRNRIARLDPANGAADSFNPDASGVGLDTTVNSIAVQADGKILVGGFFTNIGGQPRNRIARLDAVTGQADSFNPNATSGNPDVSVYSITVQADGNILVGGFFTNIGGQPRSNIARLDAVTGLADLFNPAASSGVFAIAVQADGKVLVGGGGNSTIGGQPRDGFARLTNDTVAAQNLAVTQNAVIWTRGGSSPHFSRVTFEDSTDGVNYNFLGNGTALGSNWTLTGLNLPTQQNLYIRARGFYRSGIYNGSESIQESVRNAVPAAVISGTITYGNAIGNPVPPRFVKNVSVASTAGSPAVGPVITGTPGTYTLTGFGSGSYTIKPTKPGGANGAINSFDAARVAQGVTGAVPFVSQNQRFAADASGNGGLSSTDAAKIAQFAAGLPMSPPNLSGEWRFFVTGAPSPLPTPPQTYDDSRTYSSVTASLTGEDYVGLLIGDVSGNWNPATHPRPVNSGQWTVDSEDGGAKGMPITVAVQDVVTAAEKEIVVPVNVQGVVGKEIISYEFDLRYDPAVIQPLAEPVDLSGTVSRGLSVVVNPHEPGLLRVVLYGAYPIDKDGVLLNVRFTAVGAPGSVSSLTWERIMFNEGEPRVSVTDGRIELF